MMARRHEGLGDTATAATQSVRGIGASSPGDGDGDDDADVGDGDGAQQATATKSQPSSPSQLGPSLEPDNRSWEEKTWWSVAGITLLLWGFSLFGWVDSYPWLSALIATLVIWGLGTVVAPWAPGVPRRWATAAAGITVALAVIGLLVWSYLQVVTSPGYGTDEIAFDQYAAQLLSHGLNPYTHSMAPAFALFHVSPNGYTFHLDGSPVTTLSYPALSFLVYVPFIMAGWSTQVAVAVNVAAWAVGIVLAFALLPRGVRPLAIVVGSLSVYVGYAVGGVTDALFVPLLIGAVFRWDDFARTRGPVAWRGPVLLGLAMAVKQTPWALLPFLAAGIALEARSRGSSRSETARTVGRYCGIALVAFLAPNVAFFVANPNAWLSGVLTPLSSHTVPAGQGLVGLSLFMGLGGGSLAAYTAALVIVLVAIWVIYVFTYPALKAWAVATPAIVLFFSARSFGSYLVSLLPAAIVAATTIRREPAGHVPSLESEKSETVRAGRHRRAKPAGPWRLRTVLVVSVCACVLAVGLIFSYRPPLGIAITSVRTTGQLATVVQLGVEVTNHSDHALRPAFSVESGGTLTAFWLANGPPGPIPPGQRAHYALFAPNFFAQPPISGGFQVVAFTDDPGTVSRSSPYVPTTWHVGLVPNAVNRVVPVGQVIVIHAQILDKLDRPVAVGGVPIYMGQITYAQRGLIYSEAIVNQGQIGQSPVSALTDRSGQATFVIRGTQVSNDPVYFEANLVNQSQFFPYGYSEIVPIRFGR
jgi:uncharacterized membrane protein